MHRQLMRFLVVTVLGAGLAFAPAAAGASVTAAGASCKYLKTSEVAKILHTAVKSQPSTGPSSQTTHQCFFMPTKHALPAFINISVQSGSDVAILYSVAKDGFKSTLEKAPGLGKKSFYAGSGINTAYAFRGSTLVIVQYVNSGVDQAVIKTAVLKLTKLVLRRA